ncbi:MAG: segregation and condensation protein A [Planctomycetota bacterium]|jgi:segregation and condensation protein A
MAYKVDLDVYSGPLDLLLWLIQKEEVDIYDIPISRILERYVEHLERAGLTDINNAADFLVMASTLMEIKSRMLLPVEDRAVEEEEEGDPRAELVRQLLAYRAFKEAASELGDLREVRSRRYGRGRPVELPGVAEPAEPEPLKDVTLFDIADGYARLMKQTLGSGPRTIVYDEVSLEERMEAIMGALAVRSGFALPALFAGGAERIQIAGTFFALLELVRQKMVRIFQDVDFDEIMIEKRAEEDPEAGAAAPPGPAGGAGPRVEPSLPPPVHRRELPGGKKARAAGRAHFRGLDRPDEDGDRDDEFLGSDDSELRLSRRIDRIIKYADEISERFEASRRGHRRPEGGAGASEDLDAAMAELAADGPVPGEAPPATTGVAEGQAPSEVRPGLTGVADIESDGSAPAQGEPGAEAEDGAESGEPKVEEGEGSEAPEGPSREPTD